MRDIDAMLAAIATRRSMPFDWRRNDCVRYCAAIVEAGTGHRATKGLRWGSQVGALRVLAREGGLEAAVTHRLAPIMPALAQRGDVAGVACEVLGVRLMIVEGATLVGPGEHGEVREPRAAMIRAWSADG